MRTAIDSGRSGLTSFAAMVWASVLLTGGVRIAVAAAPIVRASVDWSAQRWKGYPGNVDKPTAEWKKKVLYVQVVVKSYSGFSLITKNSRALMQGNDLTLCYRRERVRTDPRHPVPSVVTPALLDFSVYGLPERNYSIKVSPDCPAR